jgi:prepilin-type N-terminal cleavage/methylation domain-containing protein
MITTSTSSSFLKVRGFTLIELMMSMSILMIALASITGTFMVFAKSSVSVGKYVDMSNESRMALEIFSRDIRSAEALQVMSAKSADGVVYTELGMTLTFPSYHGDREVEYRYDAGSGVLFRTETYDGTESEDELLNGVRVFKIQFFQTPGDDFSSISGPLASVDRWAKSLQLDAELIRSVMALDKTDYIISARFMMRNTNRID